jgi:predicted RNA-binding protein YlqC (UPF0109 family)
MDRTQFDRKSCTKVKKRRNHEIPFDSAFSLAGNPALLQIVSMQTVANQLRSFLQYYAVQLIEHPDQAQLRVAEVGPNRLRFRLILASSDVALLIGRNGFTASAIRSVMKAAADRENVQFTLQIHSHEEEAERAAREDG